MRWRRNRADAATTGPAGRLEAPTTLGRPTGFEPAVLAGVEYARGGLLHGEPGGADGRPEDVGLARALHQQGLLGRFASFWSVQVTGDLGNQEARSRSHVDCVLVTGRHVWLVDVKNHRQGDVTWRTEHGRLICVDNATGREVGLPSRMSRNLSLATDRLTARFARVGVHHRVVARVVFMPTEAGMGEFEDVTWPGGVPGEPLPATLAALHEEPPFEIDSTGSDTVLRVLRQLSDR
jgi:hypothetical protein